MKEITANQFEKSVSAGNVIVDFFGDGCGSCKAMEPIIAAVEKEHADINFLKINVKGAEALTQKFEIMSLPTFIFFKDGKFVDKMFGLRPKTLVTKKISEVF